MKQRILIGAAALALVLGACGGGDESSGTGDSGGGGGGGVTLSAQDNSFSPAELAVPSGEVTVEFTNDGSNPHTFTSEEAGFDSGNVEPGASKSVTFEAPDGATAFECSIHGSSGMTGEIVPE
ncbi:MAG TPA: cupredoxin domain-containing protein [Actinomycetota bacterium]|nr:cupredoxin domain-containing protein [Actinomycetota bacterium]